MKEVFPLCAKTFNPEKILMNKDRVPNEGTSETMAFINSIDTYGNNKSDVIQQIRPGVVRRLKNKL